MNTNDYIKEIKERALNDDLYRRVYELYQKEIALQTPLLYRTGIQRGTYGFAEKFRWVKI